MTVLVNGPNLQLPIPRMPGLFRIRIWLASLIIVEPRTTRGLLLPTILQLWGWIPAMARLAFQSFQLGIGRQTPPKRAKRDRFGVIAVEAGGYLRNRWANARSASPRMREIEPGGSGGSTSYHMFESLFGGWRGRSLGMIKGAESF